MVEALDLHGLHEPFRVRIHVGLSRPFAVELSYLFERAARTVVIDGATAPGRDLARLLTGQLTERFGADAFRLDRLERGAGEMTDD